jgi:hypothetical protein
MHTVSLHGKKEVLTRRSLHSVFSKGTFPEVSSHHITNPICDISLFDLGRV